MNETQELLATSQNFVATLGYTILVAARPNSHVVRLDLNDRAREKTVVFEARFDDVDDANEAYETATAALELIETQSDPEVIHAHVMKNVNKGEGKPSE